MIFPFKRFFDWRSAPSLAFAATVALGYATTLWDGAIHVSNSRGLWCVVFGAIYAVLGTIDYGFFRRCVGIRGCAFYLGGQGGLLAAIIWTSRLSGETSLCAYPLVCATMALLNPAPAAAGVAAIYGMILAVEGHFYGIGEVGHWAISMIPSFGFVVIFTRIALRERAARARAEALSAEVERMAVIQERNRLAREIHDSLGHFLTTIHVQLEAARAVHAADPERALEAVGKAQDLARDALIEVRRSVGALQADSTPAPLPARMRDLASAADGWGVSVSVEISGEVRALRSDVEHALFRAAQEGLTNVRKHARARTALVTLDYGDRGRVFVCVTDDGCGAAPAASGRGLTGLRERIAALGGRVVSENPPGGGFRLRAEIPA